MSARSAVAVRVAELGAPAAPRDYAAYAAERGLGHEIVDAARARTDFDGLVRDLGRSEVNDVVAFGDRDQVACDRVLRALGRPHRDLAALHVLTDKLAFKRRFASTGLVPAFLEVPAEQPPERVAEAIGAALGYPAVLKPTRGFYSCGVVRVDGPEEVPAALRVAARAARLTEAGAPRTVLAERYIDGEEFALDGFVAGDLIPLLLHHKRPHLRGPTFHEACYLAAPWSDGDERDLLRAVETVIRATGLDWSPFHAELRVAGDGSVHVLEVAPRLAGGGASGRHLMDLALGIDAYEALHALDRREFDRGLVEPRRRRWAVEYDFPVPRSGALRDVEALAASLRTLPEARVLRSKSDGDYVLAPPLNPESVLAVFVAAQDREQAFALYNELSSLSLEVDP